MPTLLALILAGCSCNKTEYGFDPLPDPTIVEPTDFGSWLSMDIAPDGIRPTITYYDRNQKGIGFAVGTEQDDGTLAWAHEYVDGYPDDQGLDRGDRGKYTSHKVAPDGRVWVAFQDVDNGTLQAAVRNGPHDWEVERVDIGGGSSTFSAGQWASLGLIDDNTPIIAHYDGASERLRVSSKTETGWQNEVPFDGGFKAGEYATLVVAGDTAYIAYYNGVQGDLELVEGRPGSWTHSVVDETGDVGQWPSMLVVDDELWIAYHDVGNQDLKLARRVGGTWTTETIDDGEYRGADTKLFLHDGNPAIVYFDGDQNDQWLATSDGTTWSTRKLAGDGNAIGFHNEVVHVNGKTWIGSYDFTNRQLVTTTL